MKIFDIRHIIILLLILICVIEFINPKGIRLVDWSLVLVFLYPHQCPNPLITPAAQNGIHIICTNQIMAPIQPNSVRLSKRRMLTPSLE